MASICSQGSMSLSKLTKELGINSTQIYYMIQQLSFLGLMKPSWLCDCFSISLSNMRKLLFLIYSQANKITHTEFGTEFSVVQLGVDIIIFNKLFLLQHLRKVLEKIKTGNSIISFILLTGSGPSLELSNTLKNKLITNLYHLTHSIHTSDRDLHLSLPNEEMTPTIFGVMLNYPTVYISESENFTTYQMDLLLVRVSTKLQMHLFPTFFKIKQKRTEETIYSFTLPSELCRILQKNLNEWKETISKHAETLKLPIILTEENKYLQHVIL